MTDLSTRIASAECGSRELDVAIYAACEGMSEELAELRWQAYEPVSRSLDAALALVERVLPGWGVTLSAWPDEGTQKRAGRADVYDGEATFSAECATPALAMCLALLSAKGHVK